MAKPPVSRQTAPRYNPVAQEPIFTAPGCSELEASLNAFVTSINFYAQQINSLQTELDKAHLDCTKERSEGWIGYFWPACRRLEELKQYYAQLVKSHEAEEKRWNEAVKATDDLRCDITPCPLTNTNNSIPNPTLNGDLVPDTTAFDNTLNAITAFYNQQKTIVDLRLKSARFLKRFFDLMDTATVGKVPTLTWENKEPVWGSLKGTNIINILFKGNEAVFGPGWEATFADNMPGLCEDPINPNGGEILPVLKQFAEALKTIPNTRNSGTDLKALKKVLRAYTDKVLKSGMRRVELAVRCEDNFRKIKESMQSIRPDIVQTSVKIDMLKRQITNAFHDAIEFTATGSIQYSPANIPVAPGGIGTDLFVNVTAKEAQDYELVTQRLSKDNKVFFAINMGAVRKLLKDKLHSKSEPCPESGPPPVDPPPGEPEPRGVWYEYPIKAIITVTPKFKRDPLAATDNAFITALRRLSAGSNYKLEWKKPSDTTLSCNNFPVLKNNKIAPGHISIFGKPDLNIEAITNAPLNPINLESCEGKIS